MKTPALFLINQNLTKINNVELAGLEGGLQSRTAAGFVTCYNINYAVPTQRRPTSRNNENHIFHIISCPRKNLIVVYLRSQNELLRLEQKERK